MKKQFFFKNLALFLVPLLIPLFIFGVSSIVLTQNNLKSNINKNNTSLLKQTKENVELVLNEVDQLSLVYDTNADIGFEMDSILQNNSTTYERNVAAKIIKGFMNADPSARPYIYSIYVYYDSAGSNFFSSSDGVTNLEKVIDHSWYESYRKQDQNKQFWTEAREIKRYTFEEKPVQIVSIYHRMLSRKGVIILNIQPQYIENILNSITPLPDQSLLVMNEDKQVIFQNANAPLLNDIDLNQISQSSSDFFTMKFKSGSYMISKHQSERYGWKYLSIVPLQTLYEFPSKLGGLMLMLLLTAFLIGLGLTYYITSRNYRQISNIVHILDSAESGNPLPPLPDRIKDEYSYISNNILKTFIEHSFLKVTLSEKKFRMKAMELIALQAQINPHFLFNTLKTIYWKSYALSGGQNEVSKMIENLSDILDYSLNNPAVLVTLEEEIRTTMSYTEIQQVRYKDNFDIIWDIDDRVKQLTVIKLILQPIIENSIHHGIRTKEGKSLIKVKAFLVNSLLRISIIDNGIGIDPEALKKINEKLKDSEDYSDHIGLFNTDKRLKLNYGEEYGLKLKSKLGLGTVVCMYIPISPEDPTD
ncbi:sensor histidine kinase [Paenibacillus eucommiae]|uniref:Two-component system sensor histidine kinase YesM n=1 Tax=Paenibacillus eucommiae TaxID=1355755 RepID=A0ABS4JBC4_9BACL|nr:sensor histidine kinase [Paenibacillus eucommiae]MBP1996520.1 two-component system sensor histidine kinase YesM [Paenibacillus eucommiae]